MDRKPVSVLKTAVCILLCLAIIIGGLEASLRRFAHYDYWEDKVRRSILVDSGADMLVYGMGEYAEREIARRLKKKIPVSEMRDIRGTAILTRSADECAFEAVTLPSFADVCDSKRFYADATRLEYQEHDPVRGKALIQEHDGRYLIVNPPAMPLETKELDRVAELPYTKQYHNPSGRRRDSGRAWAQGSACPRTFRTWPASCRSGGGSLPRDRRHRLCNP